MAALTTELPPIRHRVRAVYIAVLLSWGGFVAVAIARAWAGKSFGSDGFIYFGLALIVLSITPWNRVLRSIVADLVILFWCGIATPQLSRPPCWAQ